MGSEGFWTQHRVSFDDPSRHMVSGPLQVGAVRR